MFKEWDRLATSVGMMEQEKLTLCHHDAHARNFLVRAEQDQEDADIPSVALIDWEFAGMSHPANELGNQICKTRCTASN